MLKLIFLSIVRSFTRPAQLGVICANAFNISKRQYSNDRHLREAMEWLCRSQDVTGCGGCSGAFGFDAGWAPVYPETTGYIISTFIRYSEYINDPLYFERARKMGDWEIQVQLPSGAVSSSMGTGEKPAVFNTGMVILGWADLYKHTADKKYLDAARKAADWLCSVMDEDGKWTSFSYNNIPHAYYSRVAWSLLELSQFINEQKYREAAIKNIKWVLSNTRKNGWIDNMFFNSGEIPLTHTIAYTLRGLLESARFLDDELRSKINTTVRSAAERILLLYNRIYNSAAARPKLLPARINDRFEPASWFSCLTGNAQIAIIWLKIYMNSQDKRFLTAALNILNEMKKVHRLNIKDPGIRGGVQGSYPIWGTYVQFAYPNWAAKFYADALMLLDSLEKEQ